MIHRQSDELVEARADLILADEIAAAAHADYFEAQMHPGKVGRPLSKQPGLRRTGEVLLAILAFLFGGLHGGEAMLAGRDRRALAARLQCARHPGPATPVSALSSWARRLRGLLAESANRRL